MNSFYRAIKLLGTGTQTDNLICIKLKSDPNSCWCFKHEHNRLFWEEVNNYLGNQGPIENEGDLLLTVEDEVYILQCHESGPEILAFMQASTALIDAITNFIKVMVESLKKEHERSHLKIMKKKIDGNKVLEEVVLDLKISSKMHDNNQSQIIKQAVKKAFKK